MCYRAARAFQHLLYQDPGFAQAAEVHIRLGVVHKVQGDYPSSLKVRVPLDVLRSYTTDSPHPSIKAHSKMLLAMLEVARRPLPN